MSALAAAFLLALSPAAQEAVRPAAEEPQGMRVLVWNIERGANPYTDGAEKALAQIRALNPDVCLLQESYDIDGERPKLGAWMAKELGWNSWQGDSTHLCVLTPLEIRDRYFHETWHGVGARLEDRAGRAFDVYSTWIDYRAYIAYALRDNPAIEDAELLRCESEGSNRLAQANALLAHLEESGRFDGSVPLLVGGDWNCPSHLDWTDDTARAFRFKRPLDLPVSRRMAAEGFIDTFREVHPDPLRRPGFTWTPMARGTVDAPMPLDRIDRLYRRPATGGELRLVPVAARVLPDRHEPAELPRTERAFPSDHGAVVIDLEWRSAGR
jgi:endonuclease/exonuclease/phosphatase family metal-dependent hydrolase